MSAPVDARDICPERPTFDSHEPLENGKCRWCHAKVRATPAAEGARRGSPWVRAILDVECPKCDVPPGTLCDDGPEAFCVGRVRLADPAFDRKGTISACDTVKFVEAAPVAPVEGPEVCPHCQRPRRPGPDGVCCWNTGGPYCAPAASPVREPPPKPWYARLFRHMYRGGRDTECGLKAFALETELVVEASEVTCFGCLEKMGMPQPPPAMPAPAAPVREPADWAGTFGLLDALSVEPGQVEIFDHSFGMGGDCWKPWRVDDVRTVTGSELKRWAAARFRRKPAPPAPKPGRLVDKLMAALHTTENGSMTFTGEAQVMLEQGILEALETVKEQGTTDLLLAVERAKAVLLGEGEVKRGG